MTTSKKYNEQKSVTIGQTDTFCNQSLCRDWSSTGLFLFDNLQMFKSKISSEHDDLQGRYCEQDLILL